ncbi:MAG TPA: helix-turn-helix transcriptional regulator [Burkholderiales bacterium]|nr:helix-turn-helix transcriptional regulator [Burkholderiales bacterium]
MPRAAQAQADSGSLLGAAIRSFRQERRQVHNGRPWTLSDLAAASGGDEAHLSRIERGVIKPNRETLLRIAQALELSRPDTEFLLRIAGFAPLFALPDAEDAAKAARWLATHAGSYSQPLTLYSIDMRVWYVNALCLRVMGLTPQWFRDCIQGRPLAETFFGRCSALDRIASRFLDYARLRSRAVARLRAAAVEGHLPPEQVAAYLADARFRQIWDEAGAVADASLHGEQSYSEIEYPGHGVLRFDNWWCPLQIDQRFLVILHLARDAATKEAIERIRREPRERGSVACQAHGHAGHP